MIAEMVRKSHFDPQRVREEIAIAAARMIAEDGLDYSTAKRKAARQVVGETQVGGEWLPDNDQIEDEIREYQSLFQSDSQPAVLRRMREVALDWMERLAAVQSVSDGRRAERHGGRTFRHPSAMFLRQPEGSRDLPAEREHPVRRVGDAAFRRARLRRDAELPWRRPNARDAEPMGIHIALYDTNDLRGAVRADGRGRLARANASAVQALLDGSDAACLHRQLTALTSIQ